VEAVAISLAEPYNTIGLLQCGPPPVAKGQPAP
jgi:hypothetical protein